MIDGTAYALRTDFRAGIAYQLKSMSGTLTERDVSDIWFLGQPPSDSSAARAAVHDFYRCGKPEPKEETAQDTPAYAFGTDCEVIIAAFQKEYGIDLTTEKLHWWRFSALLSGLLSHSFSERVQYRLCNPEEIKSKDMRARYRKLKEEYALDRNGRKIERPKTLEEHNAMLLRQARGEM